ncbi:MAG: DUF87 domain-containing protein [Anaerolineae bacterium]|nr:DUF87 domain-containing protein [Anaerolineae bacterium]
MQFSEQKNRFYLGRVVQDDGGLSAQEPFVYDARHLTTHAVCVGMTGSGKTGLGIALLEEVALSGIPTLVIDPKGDMTNLLLTFPDLSPTDLRPWVDVDGARRRNLPLDEYAGQVAQAWRDGLAEWGIDGARIARFKSAARCVVYTPGSDAGQPVSILHSLQAPALDWQGNAETLRETISGLVSALLALLNIESDPLTGREHSLLATIIEHAWRAGQDMDLARLLTLVHKPPFDQLGVLPLEVFYPEKDRIKLTLALNGLLAAPQFSVWLQGAPLRIETFLHAPDGRPQVSIFTLAHLSDVERLFFVTLLLQQVRAWLRVQQGTVDLRAVLYFDELYGFMPPHPANPPTKMPLLSLLKQARSQGLGLVLATQNPVDLDYKALSNAGTWFVGTLQTANDRQRVLEGLIGASLATDAALASDVVLDRAALDRLLARLKPRTFLVNNVHQRAPRLLYTRHTMSYLRGPLSREQIRALGQQTPAKEVVSETQDAPAVTAAANAPLVVKSRGVPPGPRPVEDEPEVVKEPERALPWVGFAPAPPVLPTGINQYFVPAPVSLEWAIHSAEQEDQTIIYTARQLVYRPALLARAAARIDDERANIHEQVKVGRVLPVPDDGALSAWDADPLAVDQRALDRRPLSGACFAPLPAQLASERRINALERDFIDYVYRDTSISLLSYARFKLTAAPDEAQSRFKRRCYQAISEKRDAELARVDSSYKSRIEQLEARIRREERELEQDEVELEARKREELLSAGESVFNLLARRRQSRMLSTASRRRRLTQQSKAEVDESLETIDDLQSQIEALEKAIADEKAEVEARWQEIAERLEQDVQTVQVRPRKTDIFVEAFGIVWLPYWEIVYEDDSGYPPVERQMSLCAFELS